MGKLKGLSLLISFPLSVVAKVVKPPEQDRNFQIDQSELVSLVCCVGSCQPAIVISHTVPEPNTETGDLE